MRQASFCQPDLMLWPDGPEGNSACYIRVPGFVNDLYDDDDDDNDDAVTGGRCKVLLLYFVRWVGWWVFTIFPAVLPPM